MRTIRYAFIKGAHTYVLYLAAASPAPIDPQLANVIAASRNAACSGPSGCAGVSSSTIYAFNLEVPGGLLVSVPRPPVLSTPKTLKRLVPRDP